MNHLLHSPEEDRPEREADQPAPPAIAESLDIHVQRRLAIRGLILSMVSCMMAVEAYVWILSLSLLSLASLSPVIYIPFLSFAISLIFAILGRIFSRRARSSSLKRLASAGIVLSTISFIIYFLFIGGMIANFIQLIRFLHSR